MPHSQTHLAAMSGEFQPRAVSAAEHDSSFLRGRPEEREEREKKGGRGRGEKRPRRFYLLDLVAALQRSACPPPLRYAASGGNDTKEKERRKGLGFLEVESSRRLWGAPRAARPLSPGLSISAPGEEGREGKKKGEGNRRGMKVGPLPHHLRSKKGPAARRVQQRRAGCEKKTKRGKERKKELVQGLLALVVPSAPGPAKKAHRRRSRP